MLKFSIFTFCFLYALICVGEANAGDLTLIGYWNNGQSCWAATDYKPRYESTIEGMMANFEATSGIRVVSFEKFKDGVIAQTKRGNFVLWYKEIDCKDPQYNPLQKHSEPSQIDDTDNAAVAGAIGFPKDFKCPESFTTNKARKEADSKFVNWAMNLSSSWTVEKVVLYRMEVLKHFHCEKTLANIEANEHK